MQNVKLDKIWNKANDNIRKKDRSLGRAWKLLDSKNEQ